MVVGVTEMEDDIKQSMGKADKVETREIKADTAEIEQDAKAAGGEQRRTPTPRTDHPPSGKWSPTTQLNRSRQFVTTFQEGCGFVQASPDMGDDRSRSSWEMVPS